MYSQRSGVHLENVRQQKVSVLDTGGGDVVVVADEVVFTTLAVGGETAIRESVTIEAWIASDVQLFKKYERG